MVTFPYFVGYPSSIIHPSGRGTVFCQYTGSERMRPSTS